MYLAIAVGLLLLAATAMVWLVYVPLLARCFEHLPWLRAARSEPISGGEDCEFLTSDGLTLRGTYLPHQAHARRGVVAFCHELTADRWSAQRYIEGLRRAGFDVFTFDFRNHGQSDGLPNYEPRPWLTPYDLDDVLSMVDYLCSRADADPRGIGLMGVSKGGSAALCAAARDPRVRAVVTDGAFTLEWMTAHYMLRYMEIHTQLSPIFSRLPRSVLAFYGIRGQQRLARRLHHTYIDTQALIRRVRQPVLLIHGERDTFVPVQQAFALRRIFRGARLWVVPEAKHNSAVQVAGEKYQRRVARFFARHFDAPRTAVPSRAVETAAVRQPV